MPENTPEPTKQQYEDATKKCKQLLPLLKNSKLITESSCLAFFGMLKDSNTSSLKMMDVLKGFYKEETFKALNTDLALFIKENDPLHFLKVKNDYIAMLKVKHMNS